MRRVHSNIVMGGVHEKGGIVAIQCIWGNGEGRGGRGGRGGGDSMRKRRGLYRGDSTTHW